MHEHLFSKVHKLRSTPSGLVNESVPETARTGLTILFYQHFMGIQPLCTSLYKELCLLLRKNVDLSSAVNENQAYISIQNMIKDCEWKYFYDACQLAYRLLMPYSDRVSKFGQSIATLFSEENLGYRFIDGNIEKIRPELIQLTLNEARVLLKEPEFKSADELFGKAIRALDVKPKPDSENCIKDAVASVEAVGKIIRKDSQARIDRIVKDAIQAGVIPQLLGDPIIKLYAYRGDEPAVAHGGIEPSKVTVDEAEFVLAMSAASIIYLVDKRKGIEGK